MKMAYVNVPKDLTKVKNKVVLNLTKRQLICFGIAAAIGMPFYFLTRGVLGNSIAMTGMVFLMVPAFLFAMYEKDGMPLEQVLLNIIRVRYQRPAVRRYETSQPNRGMTPDFIEHGASASHPEQKGGRSFVEKP